MSNILIINFDLVLEQYIPILKNINSNIKNSDCTITSDKIEENIVQNKTDLEQIKRISEIRINNTLCYFNKKEYIEFRNRISDIQKYLIDKKYTEVASLILDGEIKAYGNNYFIILFSNDNDVNLFNNNNKKHKTKLKLNLSGSLYRIIKHFRGIPDDIIIEFGDLIPVLNSENKIAKAKRKINTVINLLYEILSRQLQMSSLSNKIFAYGHIYYGGKSKEISVKDFLENDIYFDFVELK